MKTFKAILAGLAVYGMAVANPAFAAGATRSAEALPLLAANVGSVFYSEGVEARWSCVSVDAENLNLDDEYVRVDADGNVVVDAQGSPFRCRPPASAYSSGGAGFPFEIVLVILGVAGGVMALGGGGGSDSPG